MRIYLLIIISLSCAKADLPQTDFLLVADIHGFSVINLVNGDLGDHVFHNLSGDVSNIIAIDFDVVKKRVYFSDVTTKRILSSTIDGEDVRVEIINNEIVGNIQAGFERPCDIHVYQDLPQTDFLLVADIHGFDVINLVNGDLGNHVFHNLSDDVSNMIAIDFDVVKKRVYFSDVTTKRILSSTIDGEDVRIEIINNETDVISTNMSEPRTIVLDTTERMIYWTDWGLRTIERATYEGTERETLFTEKHLYFPNGLAIDFQVGRLYWVDAGYDYIGSANLDGTNVTGVATLGSMHTFGIALYKDMTVIPIWKNLSVGNTQTGFERPCDIHVYLWEECPLLSAPTNGSVSYSNSNQIGSTAYFNCDNNYYLLGNSVSICQTDDCPLLPAPTNGSVSYSNSNQYGSTAYFNCDNNYYLLGNSVSICQTDGSWNGSLPECKEK
ncbi:LRP4-like protein, partial [Mya arenaria]